MNGNPLSWNASRCVFLMPSQVCNCALVTKSSALKSIKSSYLVRYARPEPFGGLVPCDWNSLGCFMFPSPSDSRRGARYRSVDPPTQLDTRAGVLRGLLMRAPVV